MVPTIPDRLEDWNIDVLNEFTKYRDIESETFDFKGSKINKLYEDICAMANTRGGLLVLGIDEIKGSNSELIGFRKKGFRQGKEDAIGLQVGNNIFNLEPVPTVTSRHIPDKNDRFYTVLKIEHEISKKPYFVKDRGQCFVRVGNSSRPASRFTILNLFTNVIEKRSSVEGLKVIASALKEEILHLQDELKYIDVGDMSFKLTPLDLTFIKNSIVSCEWFLAEKNLLGKRSERGSIDMGFYYIIHLLSQLNTYIDAFNSAPSEMDSKKVAKFLGYSGVGRTNVVICANFLDKIISIAGEFLSLYK